MSLLTDFVTVVINPNGTLQEHWKYKIQTCSCVYTPYHEGMEVQLHEFLTSALEESENINL